MKINLDAKGKDEIRLLEYLEENASEVLAEKINNGVTVGKRRNYAHYEKRP